MHARNVVVTGNVAGLAAIATAVLSSRRQHARPKAPVNAVSHIWTGRAPLAHALAPSRRNAVIGLALHQGAAIFWAGLFEPLFGRRGERSTAAAIAGGASVAAAAYVTDYHIVPRRYTPGFEAALAPRALLLVYGALALGFAACARLRGLRHHQVENHHEREESGHAERRPDAVIAPVARG